MRTTICSTPTFVAVVCFAFFSLLTTAVQAQTSGSYTTGNPPTAPSGAPPLVGCGTPVNIQQAPNFVAVTINCTSGSGDTTSCSTMTADVFGGPVIGPVGTVTNAVGYPVQFWSVEWFTGSLCPGASLPPPPPALIITSPTVSGLTPATVGLDYEYNFPLTATGGTLPYTWTATLPAGFNVVGDTIYAPSLASLTGSGTPQITITVEDASGAKASVTVPFHIAQAPKELSQDAPDLSTVMKAVDQIFDGIEQDEPAYENITDDYPFAARALILLENISYLTFFTDEERAVLSLTPQIRQEVKEFLSGYIQARANHYSGQSARSVTIGANAVPVFDLGEATINAGYSATVFLGAATDPQAISTYNFYRLAGAVTAIEGQPISADQVTSPQEPISTTPRMFVEYGGTLYTLDPPISYGYEYRMYAGVGFQSVQIPQACASQPFPLVYQQADGSQASVTVQPGATYTFATPVRDLKVTRMVPAATCTPFLTTVGFAGSDYEVLQETNIPIAFADVLADITYAFQNGWIDNFAVGATLYLEIQGAQKAKGCPQNLLLKVFTGEVSALSGKHINSQGVALLMNDASLLASQLPATACPAGN